MESGPSAESVLSFELTWDRSSDSLLSHITSASSVFSHSKITRWLESKSKVSKVRAHTIVGEVHYYFILELHVPEIVEKMRHHLVLLSTYLCGKLTSLPSSTLISAAIGCSSFSSLWWTDTSEGSILIVTANCDDQKKSMQIISSRPKLYSLLWLISSLLLLYVFLASLKMWVCP